MRAGDIVALYQAGNFDVLGAVVVTLAQFAYLPTLVVWGVSFMTGPGFSVGEGTAVSPSGTQAGVLPGIPALGLIPESSSPWLLLVVLIPIGVGAFAGWLARSHMAQPAPQPPVETSTVWPRREEHLVEPFLPRLVVAVAVAALTAGAAAVLAVFASGSLGPGRFAHVGPSPGPVALAAGLEVLLGAAIMLLSARSASERRHATGDDATTTDASPREGSTPESSDEGVIATPPSVPEPVSAGPGLPASMAVGSTTSGLSRPAPEAGPVPEAGAVPEAAAARTETPTVASPRRSPVRHHCRPRPRCRNPRHPTSQPRRRCRNPRHPTGRRYRRPRRVSTRMPTPRRSTFRSRRTRAARRRR